MDDDETVSVVGRVVDVHGTVLLGVVVLDDLALRVRHLLLGDCGTAVLELRTSRPKVTPAVRRRDDGQHFELGCGFVGLLQRHALGVALGRGLGRVLGQLVGLEALGKLGEAGVGKLVELGELFEERGQLVGIGVLLRVSGQGDGELGSGLADGALAGRRLGGLGLGHGRLLLLGGLAGGAPAGRGGLGRGLGLGHGGLLVVDGGVDCESGLGHGRLLSRRRCGDTGGLSC